MSLKTYTITQNGSSNGNVIAQPFTIEVCKIEQINVNGVEATRVSTCTKNGNGDICDNDDIPAYKDYDLQPMTSSKNNDLVNTLEADLNSAYPGSWS